MLSIIDVAISLVNSHKPMNAFYFNTFDVNNNNNNNVTITSKAP